MVVGHLFEQRTQQRYERLRQIQSMDVETDYHKIMLLDITYEFPWDFVMGASLAFYDSVASPHMASMLLRTGELTENTMQRLEHTFILNWEMSTYGFNHDRGKAAVRQMNRVHRNVVKHISDDQQQWSIANDEYVFVLSTIMTSPLRWMDEYGWRTVSEQEKIATFLHYTEQGRHMGVTGMPSSYEEFARFHDDFVNTHFVYSPEAEKLWLATQGVIIDPLTSWLPPWLAPIGRRIAKAIAPALLTPHLRRAFGIRTPSRLLRTVAKMAVRARSVYVRWSAPVPESPLPDRVPTPSFPQGEYDIEKVGPQHTVS